MRPEAPHGPGPPLQPSGVSASAVVGSMRPEGPARLFSQHLAGALGAHPPRARCECYRQGAGRAAPARFSMTIGRVPFPITP
jgi:hypothetical protein